MEIFAAVRIVQSRVKVVVFYPDCLKVAAVNAFKGVIVCSWFWFWKVRFILSRLGAAAFDLTQVSPRWHR